MNVTIESSGNIVIAYLIGEIDHHTASAVREKIDNTFEKEKREWRRKIEEGKTWNSIVGLIWIWIVGSSKCYLVRIYVTDF